jgi:hypothetical protein
MTLSEDVLKGSVGFLDAVNRLENYLVAYHMRQQYYSVTNAARAMKLQRTALSELLRKRFNYYSSHSKKPIMYEEKACPICKCFFTCERCPSCPLFSAALTLRKIKYKKKRD